MSRIDAFVLVFGSFRSRAAIRAALAAALIALAITVPDWLHHTAA